MNTTRRTFLTKAAMPVATGVLVGSACVALAETSPADAELLALGEQLRSAWASETEVLARNKGNYSPESDKIVEGAMGVTSAVVDQIEMLSATTLAGLGVKALAVSWCHCGEPFHDDSFSYQATTDVRLAAGILRDILAMGGGA